MSRYNINDPRNSNSPYNMRNPRSPFYDTQRAWEQSGQLPISNVGTGVGSGVLAIIGLAFFCLSNKMAAVLPYPFSEHPGHVIIFIVSLVVVLIMMVFYWIRGDE
jgi:hypothetical protein